MGMVFSIFKLLGLLGIPTLRADRYSNFSGCSTFIVFGVLDIQAFLAAQYPNFSVGRSLKLDGQGCQSVKESDIFRALDIQSFTAARYSNFHNHKHENGSEY